MAAGARETVVRTCVTCWQRFEIRDEEQSWFDELSKQKLRPMCLPRECYDCRRRRRAEKFNVPVDPDAPDEILNCIECRMDFVFGGRDRQYFASRRFAVPKRCRACRDVRRQRSLTTE